MLVPASPRPNLQPESSRPTPTVRTTYGGVNTTLQWSRTTMQWYYFASTVSVVFPCQVLSRDLLFLNWSPRQSRKKMFYFQALATRLMDRDFVVLFLLELLPTIHFTCDCIPSECMKGRKLFVTTSKNALPKSDREARISDWLRSGCSQALLDDNTNLVAATCAACPFVPPFLHTVRQ